MNIKYLQLVVAAFTIEIISVLVLAILIALFGPSDPELIQAFSENMAYWLGPIAGFLFCFTGAFLLTRNLSHSRIPNGILLGLLVAIIDINIFLGSDSGFQIIYLVTNTGKIVAGTLGAYVAEKTVT